MSLSSLYANARRSLLTFQAATNVTGQNLANAESAGYTRRSARIAPDLGLRGGILVSSPPTGIGGGAGLASIERMRSSLLDAAARRGQAGREGAGTSAQLLSALDGQLAPDGGQGLLGSLSAFWGGWSAVADTPTDLAARGALVSAAGQLAGTLRSASERLDGVAASAREGLGTAVGEANGLLAEIAALNAAVRTATAQGAPDLDAQDRRDTLLDQLAGLLPVDVRPQADGSVDVHFGGMVGVQGTEARPLRVLGPPDVPVAEVRATGATVGLALSGTAGGVVGAHLSLLTTALPSARGALDTLAAQLVERVNAAHAGGTGLDGGTGRPFFDPAGTTAATIAVDPALTLERVAAGSGAPGDSSTATAIAGLGAGVQATATAMLADLGARVREATASARASDAVAAHAEALRDSVSKVSIDEEMLQMVRYQQAYAASARVLNVAGEMFDTILGL